MALSTTGFGLKPINRIGSNYNAAQVTEYKGAVYYGNAIGFQQPIRINVNGTTELSPVYSNTDNCIGSFQGVNYVDPNTSKPVFADNLPNNVADSQYDVDYNFVELFNDISFFVTDDPFQLYECKLSAALTISNAFRNYVFSDANTIDGNTKNCIAKVNATSGTANSIRPIKVVSLPKVEQNYEYESAGNKTNNKLANGSNVIVMMNNHKFSGQTSGS